MPSKLFCGVFSVPLLSLYKMYRYSLELELDPGGVTSQESALIESNSVILSHPWNQRIFVYM